MTAKTIQTELDALVRRREKLEQDLEAARIDLESRQGDLIDGKAGAEEAAELAQARVTSLEGTLRLLNARIAGVQAELDSARAAEARTSSMKHIEKLAREAAAIREAQENELRQAVEQVNAAHHAGRTASRRLNEIRVEIMEAYRQDLQGDPGALEEIEAGGVTLDSALTGFGRSDGLPRHYNVEVPDHGRFGGSLRKLLRDAAEADHIRERRAAKAERDAARAA